jgi:hypothetical protein
LSLGNVVRYSHHNILTQVELTVYPASFIPICDNIAY